ncbi:uncharacterized protein LOC132379909 isoform X11 [Hypanus sabinus]|uniref:uncharacterized protein LOC132379909 isoform X11 n=1 Tax=Hypanus sabinus TaxID=79690 RepID=UPI0028C39BE2|nr:uncharacterized protein LOC132379909 isoform X11 [Hypanus sabinus]
MTSEENGKDLIFEGYLKKQKDKMKFAWAKYWFRLQNTTLFFFTDKQCEACHLRGQYYIYMVQSVREKEDRNHEYLFEIVMKNGKKKVLAAESSDLRAVWMEFLWKAMQLPGPGKKNSACTWHDIPHLIQRAASLCPNTTKREDSTGSLYSTDTQSEDYTPDTVHLASPVRSRQTSSTASDLDESSNMRCSNITSSSEEGESLDNEATTASQGVQAPCEELFTSIPEVNLLDEIISGFSRSTSCWLDSQYSMSTEITYNPSAWIPNCLL